MAQPQQAFDIPALIQQATGAIQSNNDLNAALLNRVNSSRSNGVLKNILGGLGGAALGALGSRFDDNVGLGEGAIFGGLAGGLLTNRIRRTNQQNALQNMQAFQAQNNNNVTQLMELMQQRTAGDAINQIRNDRGLDNTNTPLYGASDAIANIMADTLPTKTLGAAVQIQDIAQNDGFGRGLGTASQSGSPLGQFPNVGGGVPVQAPAGLETDPSVVLGPNGVLQGGVQQQTATTDPRISDLLAQAGPAMPVELMKQILGDTTSSRNTGLEQGVDGARVPSQNRKDDASARKSNAEADFVPFEAQTGRISANASMANAGANNTRANAYAQTIPSVIARNNAFGQGISEAKASLGSLNSEMNTVQRLMKEARGPELDNLQQRMNSLQTQAAVLRAQMQGANVAPGAAAALSEFGL